MLRYCVIASAGWKGLLEGGRLNHGDDAGLVYLYASYSGSVSHISTIGSRAAI